MTEPTRLLRHVVLFEFKDGTTPEQIAEIENAFRALPGQIDAIHSFEWGTDVSVEGITRGYSHCFFLSFKSEEDRAVYLPHPAHKAFGQKLGPYKEQVLVLDYWSQT